MDTLADAITSVEYYLERLSDDPETTDDILQLARASVDALGYPLEQASDFGDDQFEVERIELEAEARTDSHTADESVPVHAEPDADITDDSLDSDDLNEDVSLEQAFDVEQSSADEVEDDHTLEMTNWLDRPGSTVRTAGTRRRAATGRRDSLCRRR